MLIQAAYRQDMVMVRVMEAWSTFAVCQRDFYSVLSPITRIGQICGIFPLTLKGAIGKRKYSTSYISIIYSLIVMVLTVTGLYACTGYTNERQLKISHFAVVSISIHFELILDMSSIIVMVVSAILSEDKLANAIHSISSQDVLLQKLGTKLEYTAEVKKSYIQVGIIIFTLSMLCTFDFTHHADFNISYPLNWISWICPNVIRIVSACLFVDVIMALKQRFGALNEHLRKLIEETKDYSLGTISAPERICDRIRSIATIHGALCEAALSINQTFNFTIIVGVIYALIIQTTSMYYIFQEIKQSSSNYLAIGGSLNWALIGSGHIIYIVMACRLTQDQACLAGKLIHKIPISGVDTLLNDVIQSFSLQMHHEKIEFSGAGLFPLDATLIQSIVGAVTTYLVILIQFDSSQTSFI